MHITYFVLFSFVLKDIRISFLVSSLKPLVGSRSCLLQKGSRAPLGKLVESAGCAPRESCYKSQYHPDRLPKIDPKKAEVPLVHQLSCGWCIGQLKGHDSKLIRSLPRYTSSLGLISLGYSYLIVA